MRTFSLNTRSATYAARLCQCIQENYGYIYYFNGHNTAEAIQRIFLQAMRTEKQGYADLTPYVKKLARNIMKVRNKETPYSLYNEDGEVSVAFIGLVGEDTYTVGDKESISAELEELYLQFPEDFMRLKYLIPSVEGGDVQETIKNPELKRGIFRLMHDFTSSSVFYTLIDFLKEIEQEKQTVQPVAEEKVLALQPANYKYCSNITDKKWLRDKNGRTYGINPKTLMMDDGFNVEFNKFRLAVPTSCNIWCMSCADYFADIETLINVEAGVDNKYILWCRSKYRLTTPAGTSFMGISRDKYMERVRHELILSVLASGLGTVVAVSPDNIYLKLNRASTCTVVKMKSPNGTIYSFPMAVQQVEKCGY